MAPARARSAAVEQPHTAPSAESTSTHAETAANGTEPRPSTQRGVRLNLPFVTAEFRKPDLHLPGRRELGTAAGAVTARARSLSPAELARYAGLGLLAVVDIVEWPVALIVGAGTHWPAPVVAASAGEQSGST